MAKQLKQLAKSRSGMDTCYTLIRSVVNKLAQRK